MKKRINDGWSFAKLPSGSSFADAEKAPFQPVDIPHDWLIWQENDLYETADAWYRRTLDPAELPESVHYLGFDGVYMDCEIYVNEEPVYSHPYGYTPFFVPLNGHLREGPNLVTVHIRHQSPNSRWYSGSGIYRDVTIRSLPENHLWMKMIFLLQALFPVKIKIF